MVQHASARSPDPDPNALLGALSGSAASPESSKLSLVTPVATGQPAPQVLPASRLVRSRASMPSATFAASISASTRATFTWSRR